MQWSTAEGVFCVACAGLPFWLVLDGIYDLTSVSAPVDLVVAILQLLVAVALAVVGTLYLRRPVGVPGELPSSSDYLRLARGLARRGR